jgi:Tfp pilus assembly protein PilO
MAGGLKNKVDDIKLSFERMSSRERVMVSALGGVFLFLLVVGGGYWIYSGLEEREQQNAEMRKALRLLKRNKGKYLEARRRQAALERQIPREPLDLLTYVSQVFKGLGLQESETSPKPPVVGPRYTRTQLEIKANKLSISQVASLLKQLESSTSHVVQVTDLSVRTRYRDHEKLDVEITVTSYSRSKKGAKRKKKSGSKRGRRG